MIFKWRTCLTYVLILLFGGVFYAHARQITDMTGRNVILPEKISYVYAASPPATYLVYAMDPGLLAGLNFPIDSGQAQYLDPRMQDLPVIGGWFGQGNVANLETLLKVNPDIILLWQWKKSVINKKIERALAPLNIPIVYVTIGGLNDYPAVFEFLGEVFKRPERASALAAYAKETLEQTGKASAGLDEFKKVSVYYAEGADGLSTECHTSMHAELIPLSGGKNVHRCMDDSTYGMQKISIEQILLYAPDVIIFHEPRFSQTVQNTSKWKGVPAIKAQRVYQIPRIPFNWFDRPPSFMRLLGLKWMTHKLYPKAYPLDLVAETRRFYQLFLNLELDEAKARKVLQP